ncbi:MAG: hypothetical protein QXI33_02030 [Candidatus Pacearchaeota archaeon]
MIIPDDEKTETEKLEEEIRALKTRIKNTEYDLANMFKGNPILQEKLDISKKMLNDKINTLNNIKSEKYKSKKIKEFENKITEKSDIPITKEQENIINETIEEEFN